MEKVYIKTKRWDRHYRANPAYKQMVAWLKDTLGPSHFQVEGKRHTTWMHRYQEGDQWVFSFTNPGHAAIFALKWT